MRQIPAAWFVLHLMCALCGAQAAQRELAPPHQSPVRWLRWNRATQDRYAAGRDQSMWWLIVESERYDNGPGENVTAERAKQFSDAFHHPRTYQRVHRADLYSDAGFCAGCDAPYCEHHWTRAPGERASCPHGHQR
ncbi:hypothetical protein G3I60_24105 [Streptomyces sp. SID13666]|uniref:hypothetical protein n=1 Tax=unclassified Streptomyces TaxID=2593676 RepID=UPI0013C1BE48|nr:MULTISPECIES: hypothetical protein [unclassified Streptomyces]NEA57147.1 hypothetical protein [Streptomyces sp. SID13666]NEA76891.1 hypothetical protein [Streptomyces sp. SID13588]